MTTMLAMMEGGPTRIGLGLLIVLPIAAAYGLFFFMSTRDNSHILNRLKWLSALPLVLAAGNGAFLSYRISVDHLYQQYFQIGTGMTVMHYACLVAPILALGGLFLLNSRLSSSSKYDF